MNQVSQASSNQPRTKEDDTSLPEMLEQLRDEIRLQIHLAGMEAKQTWSGLEAQLEAVLRSVHNTTEAAGKFADDAKENAQGALEDLKVRFELFRDSLKQMTRG